MTSTKRVGGILAILSAVTLSGCVAATEDRNDRAVTSAADPDNHRLIHLQEKLAAAMAPLDSVALDSILADDVHSRNAADKPLDKKTMLQDLRAAQSVLLNVRDDSIAVRRYGDMALMTMREVVTMRSGDTSAIGHLRMTEVWLKRAGKWQAVGGQALVIP